MEPRSLSSDAERTPAGAIVLIERRTIMKHANWKRVVVGALMVLSVTGSSLAPVVAGHAAAETCTHPPKGSGIRPVCFPD